MTMSQELALKRPAEVTRAQPLPPARRTETLIGSQQAINKELARLKARGEFVSAGPRVLIQRGRMAGYVEVQVIRQEPKRWPRWAKICLGVGLVLGPPAILTATILWLLASLSAGALALLCALALLGLGALVGVLVRSGGSGRARGVTVSVTTTTNVTVN